MLAYVDKNSVARWYMDWSKSIFKCALKCACDLYVKERLSGYAHSEYVRCVPDVHLDCGRPYFCER